MNSKIRILVVDDEPPILEVLKRYLIRCGYTVLTAVNVAEAVEILTSESLEIVLSDITFPDKDGYFLLNHIKTSYPDIAVIMMTGHTEYHTVKESLRQGADEYIPKPIDFEELSTVIDKITWSYVSRWQDAPGPAV